MPGSARATAVTCVALLALLLGAAAALTDSFSAFTLESARRLQASRSNPDVADLRLDSLAQGQRALRDYAGDWLIVDFMYTRCATLCVSLGSTYARLQRELAPEIARGEVRLLSLSFDPEHDGAAQLADYRARHSRDARGWDLGTAPRPQLAQWLDRFGVVVIPDPWSGYTHNAALHLVGPERRLRAIFDGDDIEAVRAYLRIEAGGDRDG